MKNKNHTKREKSSKTLEKNDLFVASIDVRRERRIERLLFKLGFNRKANVRVHIRGLKELVHDSLEAPSLGLHRAEIGDIVREPHLKDLELVKLRLRSLGLLSGTLLTFLKNESDFFTAVGKRAVTSTEELAVEAVVAIPRVVVAATSTTIALEVAAPITTRANGLLACERNLLGGMRKLAATSAHEVAGVTPLAVERLGIFTASVVVGGGIATMEARPEEAGPEESVDDVTQVDLTTGCRSSTGIATRNSVGRKCEVAVVCLALLGVGKDAIGLRDRLELHILHPLLLWIGKLVGVLRPGQLAVGLLDDSLGRVVLNAQNLVVRRHDSGCPRKIIIS